MEKTKAALENPQNKKKPLRDQHVLREKLVGDCQIQKTKISLSVEKLQVFPKHTLKELFKTPDFQLHFRSGIGGDSTVTHTADELLRDLDHLNLHIKEQSKQLEGAVAQVDQYQLEVQQLRQHIIQVEQQLRSVLNPTQLTHDSEQLVREQQVGV